MDDSDEELEMTIAHQAYPRMGEASSSKLKLGGGGGSSKAKKSIALRPQDQAEVEARDAEIQEVAALLNKLRRERQEFIESARMLADEEHEGRNVMKKSTSKEVVDYTTEDFIWSGELLPRARKTWPAVKEFRFDQKAVCNAALDGRDTVVVMPTGGGKSLCYQLPAILDSGMTLVISPLLSLSYDQCLHLREAGVSCEMLSAAVSKEDSRDILRRVKFAGKLKGEDEEIKVLFVTPERIAKSKTLLAALQGCFGNGRLSRIVVDEAHCCSQMGHDFRPDYKQLSKLRTLWPSVPIMALSATLSPTVREDVRKILGLGAMTDFRRAEPDRTVYFTAPLHRPNLHYIVLPRDGSVAKESQNIVDWILEKHRGHSGIVYCLSKKDAEVMSKSLTDLSGGKITAAWYHADLHDEEKMRIHQRWRTGKIQVVASTIAFGMGIDLGSVRYVIHACPSKSLDGYLQESGRAGRDGKDADCVLYYRPQDATRIAGLITGDRGGQEKLHSMISYAQSHKCRKALFSEYFRDAYSTSEPCGKCDNCNEKPEAVDVTLEAWQLLCALADIHGEDGRVTLSDICKLARGLSGGQYNVVEGGGGKRKRQKGANGKSRAGFFKVDEDVGVLKLNMENAERLAVHLLATSYMGYVFNPTAYTVNVYVKPGPLSSRLTDLSKDDIDKLDDKKRIHMCLLDQPKRGAAKKANAAASKGKGKGKATQPAAASKKRKSRVDSSGEDEDDGVDYNDSDVDDPIEEDEEDTTAADEAMALALQAKWAAEDADSDDEPIVPRASRKSNGKHSKVVSDEDEDDDGWEVFGGTGQRLSGNVSIGDASAPIEID